MARANADSRIRFAAQALLVEVVSLLAAAVCVIGYRGDRMERSFQPFALIILTALAMGIRNAAVRKLAIPDLTTTTDPNGHGYRCGFLARKRQQPEIGAKSWLCLGNFFGAALGAVVTRYSISGALGLATGISVVCNAALFRSFRTSDQP